MVQPKSRELRYDNVRSARAEEGVLRLVLTEPALIPMRSLFARMGWFQNTPIDMSFMVTVLILSVLRSVPMVL